MKKLFLISLLIGALPLSMVAQDDDLYFVPKKKSAVETVNDHYGLPRETYYSGSNRSVDDYNRRVSTYEPIDSASSDIIDFNGELGVYPDSLDDYNLTRKMERFDEYRLSDNAAFWAGYQEGRHDLWWHSPWYYRTYGWYNWYDPWYYTSYHYGLFDPWYYGPVGWYDPWYYNWYGYYWDYPYYRYGHAYWGGGLVSNHRYNDHAGTIHMNSGNMNGRIYSSATAGGVRSSGGSTRLGAQRTSSLRNRTVGNHSAYSTTTNSRTSRTAAETTRRAATTYTPTTTSSGGGSIGGGGFSGGGGRASGGGGGGGGRSAGGHAGGRR